MDFKAIMPTTERRSISSSGVGITVDTREMIESAAQHNIVTDSGLMELSKINAPVPLIRSINAASIQRDVGS